MSKLFFHSVERETNTGIKNKNGAICTLIKIFGFPKKSHLKLVSYASLRQGNEAKGFFSLKNKRRMVCLVWFWCLAYASKCFEMKSMELYFFCFTMFSSSDTNILGSDFISLNESHSSFTNGVLTLGIGFPDQYEPATAYFSESTAPGASFQGAYSGFWETFMDTIPGNECLRILKGTFDWQDVLDNIYMGLGLHYAGKNNFVF
jgi:hypothetical protein